MKINKKSLYISHNLILKFLPSLILSMIITYYLFEILYKQILHIESTEKYLVKLIHSILFFELKNSLYRTIATILLIYFVLIVFFKLYWPLLNRLRKTPLCFYDIMHGINWGSIIGILGLIIFSVRFQKIIFFNADYLAISIFISILHISIGMWIKKIIKDKKEVRNDPFDEFAISSLEEDIFSHSRIAKEIFEEVSISSNKGKVIALYGRNGIGKSSTINLFKVIANNDERFIYEDFEVYKYKSDEEMTKQFFEKIISSVSRGSYLPGLSQIPDFFLRFLYGLSYSNKSYKYTFNSLIHIFSKDKTHEEYKEIIENYIEYFGLKIVIIIDDLDRCSVKKRYLLFQLINSIGRINNLFYLISASANEILDVKEPSLTSIVD